MSCFGIWPFSNISCAILSARSPGAPKALPRTEGCRPDGFPCSSPESSATSADLDRRIAGKLQVEDKASRFKSYHAADKCYKRWRALRTSPDGRAELLEFFVFSVCYECYAHSLRALLAVRTPLFRFGLPAQAGLWRACIPVREGTSLRCAQRHRGDCLGGGGIDAASRRQAQGAGGPLPLVGPAPTEPGPLQSASSGAAEPRNDHRVAALRNETKRPAPHGSDPVESRPVSLGREGRADSAQGPCSASALVRAELRAPAARALPLPPLPRRGLGGARPNLTARPSSPAPLAA